MTTLELLQAARKRIETPEQWCQKTYARDAKGYQTGITDPTACRFCVEGALFAAAPQDFDPIPTLKLLEKEAGERLPSFNDKPSRTHGDVLDLFDRAITEAQRKQAAGAAQ